MGFLLDNSNSINILTKMIEIGQNLAEVLAFGIFFIVMGIIFIKG